MTRYDKAQNKIALRYWKTMLKDRTEYLSTIKRSPRLDELKELRKIKDRIRYLERLTVTGNQVE